jgi:hypothetical protein
VRRPSRSRWLPAMARASQGALQWAVLAPHQAAPALGHATQNIHRANVAIGAPQSVWVDEGQSLAPPRTFLGVTVYTQGDRGGQHRLRLHHHQHLAGPRGRPRPAQGVKAMGPGGARIALEPLRAVSRPTRWQRGLQGPSHRGRLPHRVLPHGVMYQTLLALRCRVGRPALARRQAPWAGRPAPPVPTGRPRRTTAMPASTVLRRCVQTPHRSCRHGTDGPTRRAPSRRSVFAQPTAHTLSRAVTDCVIM